MKFMKTYQSTPWPDHATHIRVTKELYSPRE